MSDVLQTLWHPASVNQGQYHLPNEPPHKHHRPKPLLLRASPTLASTACYQDHAFLSGWAGEGWGAKALYAGASWPEVLTLGQPLACFCEMAQLLNLSKLSSAPLEKWGYGTTNFYDSFSRYLLGHCYVPGPILGPDDRASIFSGTVTGSQVGTLPKALHVFYVMYATTSLITALGR